MSSVESVEAKLIHLLSQKYGHQPDMNECLALLCLDSVGMAELSFEIEQQFNVKIDDHFHDLDTVQDLANYIRQLESSSHRQQ